MRRIGVVTGSRADYGILRPVLRALTGCPEIDLRVYVCGSHLAATFGSTVRDVEADGFPIAARVATLFASDSPDAIAKSMAAVVAGFADVYTRDRPEILVVLGDRYEMFAAAAAAVPFVIPLAHIHGGETTEAAIDDCFRHAITKISHLHLVATKAYAQRVIQMGESPERVIVVGAPALDNLRSISLPTRDDIQGVLGLPLTSPPLLATFHPETRNLDDVGRQIDALYQALNEADCPIVITLPGADTAYGRVISAAKEFVAAHPAAVAVEHLGTELYFGLMAIAGAMVGNSSSGLIEAASFRLPVVNVGDRQKGRIRSANIIDVPCERDAISCGIRTALSEAFRKGLVTLTNPLGDGFAAERILAALLALPLNAARSKPFYAIGMKED